MFRALKSSKPINRHVGRLVPAPVSGRGGVQDRRPLDTIFTVVPNAIDAGRSSAALRNENAGLFDTP
jgi:hypothetical protein